MERIEAELGEAHDDGEPMVLRPGPSPTTPEREERIRKWREEHADAIRASADYVRKHGIILRKHRQF